MGLVQTLSAMLATEQGELLVIVSGVLKNLSTLKSNRKIMGAKELGVVVGVKVTLSQEMRDVKDNCLSILRNLSKSVENLTYFVSSELGLPQALILLIYRDVPQVHWGKICEILKNFTVKKSSRKYLASVEVALLEALVYVIGNTRDTPREQACEVLAIIAKGTPGRDLSALERGNVIITLRDIIIESEGRSREYAIITLTAFTVNEKNREYLTTPELGLISALTTVAEAHCGSASSDSRILLQSLGM